MARQDVEHLEEICRRRKEENVERKKKLIEFWDRKVAKQIAWVEEGFELEKKWEEDRKQKIANRKAKAMNISIESESSEELEEIQSEESEQNLPIEEELEYVDLTCGEIEEDQESEETVTTLDKSVQIITIPKSDLKLINDEIKKI
ncbi:uncharacterized protein NPIL_382891 [Nephila pilipes]|uniref:Uncharacterized protein n=1 Tax=Nephila pilipes TaxID=299642 RepID=A0A8X6UJV3_NEPPI|nr:uncharacterized protein NPIL_382891 [Nephila pilipes]